MCFLVSSFLDILIVAVVEAKIRLPSAIFLHSEVKMCKYSLYQALHAVDQRADGSSYFQGGFVGIKALGY